VRYIVPFRTAALVVIALAVLLAAFVLGLRPAFSATAIAIFPHLVTGACVLVGIGAGKSAIEHLGNGSGVIGAAKVLFTSARPESGPEVKP
jgi:hypothetical protein